MNHKSLGINEYMGLFVKELNRYVENKDFRGLVLATHLFLEYWINELIKENFPRPEKLLKKNFLSKLDVVESLSIIKNEKIVKNCYLINQIRNHTTHTLIVEEIINDCTTLIKNMEQVPEQIVTIQNFDVIPSFQTKSVGTIISLANLCKSNHYPRMDLQYF